MDVKRTNQLIMSVVNGHKAEEICENDTERTLFADLEAERDRLAQYGIGLSPVNEIND